MQALPLPAWAGRRKLPAREPGAAQATDPGLPGRKLLRLLRRRAPVQLRRVLVQPGRELPRLHRWRVPARRVPVQPLKQLRRLLHRWKVPVRRAPVQLRRLLHRWRVPARPVPVQSWKQLLRLLRPRQPVQQPPLLRWRGPVQLLRLQPLHHQPRGLLHRSVRLPLFRRISDCLSPLKVFRLEGNTHVPHRGLNDRASYFRENESIVTGSTGVPSVALAPGAIPAAAILVTTSSPDVTLPTTV